MRQERSLISRNAEGLASTIESMDGELLEADIRIEYAIGSIEEIGWKPGGRYAKQLERALNSITQVRRALQDKLDRIQ